MTLFPLNMTHKECVEAAYKWVLKNGSVGFAFKELVSLASEIPDVIGFNSWESIMIECKVSRSDFLRDKKKTHRSTTKGMGNWRFYCCPKGMITPLELPQKWGLIYVNEDGKARIEYDCRKKKVATPELHYLGPGHEYRIATAYENKFEVDMGAERAIFYTALRRLHLRGRIPEIYSMPDDGNA